MDSALGWPWVRGGVLVPIQIYSRLGIWLAIPIAAKTSPFATPDQVQPSEESKGLTVHPTAGILPQLEARPYFAELVKMIALSPTPSDQAMLLGLDEVSRPIGRDTLLGLRQVQLFLSHHPS
jgi:hypothetical protein